MWPKEIWIIHAPFKGRLRVADFSKTQFAICRLPKPKTSQVQVDRSGCSVLSSFQTWPATSFWAAWCTSYVISVSLEKILGKSAQHQRTRSERIMSKIASFDWSKHPPVKLNFNVIQPKTELKHPNAPIVLHHGLLSSIADWDSMARKISDETGREVYLVEPRNHGKSPSTPGHSYQLLASGKWIAPMKNISYDM